MIDIPGPQKAGREPVETWADAVNKVIERDQGKRQVLPEGVTPITRHVFIEVDPGVAMPTPEERETMAAQLRNLGVVAIILSPGLRVVDMPVPMAGPTDATELLEIRAECEAHLERAMGLLERATIRARPTKADQSWLDSLKGSQAWGSEPTDLHVRDAFYFLRRLRDTQGAIVLSKDAPDLLPDGALVFVDRDGTPYTLWPKE